MVSAASAPKILENLIQQTEVSEARGLTFSKAARELLKRKMSNKVEYQRVFGS